MEKKIIEWLSAESEEEKSIRRGHGVDKNLYTYGGGFVVSEEKLNGKAKEVSIRTHTRYTDFPEHSHSYVEIMIVLRGSITHRIKNERITLTEGEMLLFNRHVTHSVETANESDIGVNVIMSDRFSESVSSDLSDNVFSPFFSEHRKHAGKPMYLHFSLKDDSTAGKLIEILLAEQKKDAPSSRITAKTFALLLSYLSERRESLLVGGTPSVGKKQQNGAEITEYIKSSYRTASLTELSRRMYLSAPYLSKLTRELFGKSFKELVVAERIERAEEMLGSTKMSVGDIIRAVGYENESYFHREYKRLVGCTPLQTRKRQDQGTREDSEEL